MTNPFRDSFYENYGNKPTEVLNTFKSVLTGRGLGGKIDLEKLIERQAVVAFVRLEISQALVRVKRNPSEDFKRDASDEAGVVELSARGE